MKKIKSKHGQKFNKPIHRDDVKKDQNKKKKSSKKEGGFFSLLTDGLFETESE